MVANATNDIRQFNLAFAILGMVKQLMREHPESFSEGDRQFVTDLQNQLEGRLRYFRSRKKPSAADEGCQFGANKDWCDDAESYDYEDEGENEDVDFDEYEDEEDEFNEYEDDYYDELDDFMDDNFDDDDCDRERYYGDYDDYDD